MILFDLLDCQPNRSHNEFSGQLKVERLEGRSLDDSDSHNPIRRSEREKEINESPFGHPGKNQLTNDGER